MHKFSLQILTLAICLTISHTSARFFPNMTNIPPWLLPNVSFNAASTAWDAFHSFGNCQPGQTVDGLAKLKKYLNYFGYIPNLPSNSTDDFDDQLESAIKTYQKNFNLNVTGELDDQTINHLVRPRCGNPDIINGTTTMNSGKPMSFNGSNLVHSVGHYSFFPGTPTWPAGRRDLKFAFLPDNELSDDVKAVFVNAFQKWSTVIPMTFTETTSYYNADIKIGFYVGDHGDGEPFDGVLGTLAHAFSPPSGLFHLDGDEDWVIGGDISTSSVSSAIDLESVAVHEIGHLLGLGHSSVEESIMYPTITSKTKKVDLANDDVDGIQSLYGANPSYDGRATSTMPTPSTQARETSAAAGGGHMGFRWGVVGVGLVVLMF